MADRICSVDGCDRPFRARGMCHMHWKRWRKYGDPNIVAFVKGDTIRNFWAKVDRRGPEECWPWLGNVTPNGYGTIQINGHKVGAHRYSHEINIGPIPDGLTIDHVLARGCTRRDCVNPAHLEAVTQEENTARSSNPTANNLRKTHCPAGHELTNDNVYVGPKGGRRCRSCRVEQKRIRTLR